MIVVRRTDELRQAILERRVAGDSVGFVPTMGMLHDGQLSLVSRARAENGCVVVSSFSNPGAFLALDEGSGGPRDQARDLALLEHARTDIAFVPEAAALFPPDDTTRVTVEGLTRQLEGASRPGHLDGLTTVMLKLIHLVGPARLYLGQRHAQQVVIVRRMLRDLFLNVDLVICPTVRAEDGLAMSSANAQLGIEERHAATCIPQALMAAKDAYDAGERSAEVLRWRMTDVLSREPRARIDYVSVADASTLAELQRVSGPALALIAVGIGRTRLTDNRHRRPRDATTHEGTSAVTPSPRIMRPVTRRRSSRIAPAVHGRPASAHVRPPFALFRGAQAARPRRSPGPRGR